MSSKPWHQDALQYEPIASEYYDKNRHPTSWNFRQASAYWLTQQLDRLSILASNGTICEVGCGDSLVAETISNLGLKPQTLILLDSSKSMLSYSKHWTGSSRHRVLGSVEQLPLRDSSLDLLISVLGDPYNNRRFWQEAIRAIKPGGMVLYCAPSYEWSSIFRSSTDSDERLAEFTLRNGESWTVPSLILPKTDQVALMLQSGLNSIETTDVETCEVDTGCLSPKLLTDSGQPVANLVTGYMASK